MMTNAELISLSLRDAAGTYPDLQAFRRDTQPFIRNIVFFTRHIGSCI